MAPAGLSSSRVDSARAACEALVRTNPDDAGALHVLGIIAHDSGDRPVARKLLARAAEAKHALPLHILSFAELCLKEEDLAEAIVAVRRALALDGTVALAWWSLGGMLLESGQFEEGRDAYQRAAQLDSKFWQARSGLATALCRLGRVAEAIDTSETLLREYPSNAAARDAFAKLLQEMGLYGRALTLAEAATVLEPTVVDFQLRAADIELNLGRHEAALARLQRLDIAAHGDVKLICFKAHLLRLVEHFDAAVEICRTAVENGVKSAELFRAYGLALHQVGSTAEALSRLDEAAAAGCVNALSDKGLVLTQLGRLGDACDAFDQALLRQPRLADAWYNKSSAKHFVASDPDIDGMERLLDGYCSARDELLLRFALGKAHMDVGNPEVAFLHWHEGNRQKRASIDYDADGASRAMAAVAERYATRERLRPIAANPSDLPVFIVGMPRSGSSLLEQVLASHPEVHGGGELLQIRCLFESADAGSDDALAECVLARLRRASPSAVRVVDKDLGNFLHLGLIHRTFPRARIIHCRRSPLDTCLSIYTRLFLGDFGFAYDLAELGRYYRDYQQLMTHWRSLLPSETFIEIDYENFVTNQEQQTRRLLEFLGLSWNDACMRFFETERPVRTSSFAQVRRPIYRSSVGRASALRSHLQPLVRALGDLAPDFALA